MDKLKDKNIQITLAIIVALLLVGFLLTRGEDSKKSDDDGLGNALPTVEVIPTVTDDVEVSINPDAKNQFVDLVIENYPKGTSAFDYEISYKAEADGIKVNRGSIGSYSFGKIPSKNCSGDDVVTCEIALGTESSGVYRFDAGVTSVSVNIRFEGEYGKQLFQGDFELTK